LAGSLTLIRVIGARGTHIFLPLSRVETLLLSCDR
jgi:hypothetical protein